MVRKIILSVIEYNVDIVVYKYKNKKKPDTLKLTFILTTNRNIVLSKSFQFTTRYKQKEYDKL